MKKNAVIAAVLCCVTLLTGCFESTEKKSKGIISLTSSTSTGSADSSASGSENIASGLDASPADTSVMTADIYIRSLDEALAHFSEIESKTPEGSPEEIVKTLLERNILCFATMQGKCWIYDELEYSHNFNFSNGVIPIQSRYLSSAQQINDLFYGTYIESKADYLIHYYDGYTTADAFSGSGSLYADCSQLLKTAMNSFETPTYAAIVSASDDEIVFERYYGQYNDASTPAPNTYQFRAVRRGGEWRLENYIIDAPAYKPMYYSMIQTNRTGNPDIEKIAMTELGNFGGEPYWSWYGFDYQIEWCAAFVSWCYNEAGADGPFFVGVSSEGVPWFMEHDRWVDEDYRDIAPGDSIFFDWDLDGIANHVGLVIGTDGVKVYTIEGNRSDACQQFAYDLDDPRIFGYGLMEWD